MQLDELEIIKGNSSFLVNLVYYVHLFWVQQLFAKNKSSNQHPTLENAKRGKNL